MRLALVAVLALVSLASAPARAADWTTYRYPELGFTVAFPAAPTRMSKPQDTPSGAIPTEYVYVAAGGGIYLVSSSDLSAQPDILKAPDASARQLLDGAMQGGTVISPPARLSTAAAWEGVALLENKRARVRAYMRGKRAFTVMIIAPPDHPERAADADAERFFTSFTPSAP
jgi:hypothetical protein